MNLCTQIQRQMIMLINPIQRQVINHPIQISDANKEEEIVDDQSSMASKARQQNQ